MARFVACLVCGTPLAGAYAHRTWCSDACKMRAYRRRKQGLPEDYARHGAGNRGPISMRAQRERVQRVTELVAMGIELKHDRVMFLLHH